MRVLIVDDSRIVRERLTAMLADVAPDIEQIAEARDPSEARERLRSFGPDVVILEIRMPGGDGLDMLQEIKRLTPSPIVLVLTNTPLAQYRHACAQAGADYFFDKSGDLDPMRELLRRLTRVGDRAC
jgi:DNA-binding NarL/FixJ family response regulator